MTVVTSKALFACAAPRYQKNTESNGLRADKKRLRPLKVAIDLA
jgi:hypothetical protein